MPLSLIASIGCVCQNPNYIPAIDCDPDIGNNECQAACQARNDPGLNSRTGTCLNVGDGECNPASKLLCLCSGQPPVAACRNYVTGVDCLAAAGNKECQHECQLRRFVTGSCLASESLSDAGACSITASKVCVCYCNPFAP
ncbi:hypothetical protein AAVH_22802 [Aphelenchoides avenae]|nr:hypothetical protein AAVH_22802 [Aphelenchus avenae]